MSQHTPPDPQTLHTDAPPAPALRRSRWESAIRWYVLLGGMTAFALHLLTGFYLVPFSCFLGTRLPLVAVTIVFAAMAAGAFWLGWVRRAAHGEDERPGWAPGRGARTDRARFMISAGLVLNGLGLMIILYAGAAIISFDPCVNWRI